MLVGKYTHTQEKTIKNLIFSAKLFQRDGSVHLHMVDCLLEG